MTPALREIADLPGPPGLPLIGNTLQVQRSQVALVEERHQLFVRQE